MATFSRNQNVARDYLDTVDERLKKRGGSILQGSEVQGGFILPEGRSSSFRPGLTGARSSQPFPQSQVLQANIPQQQGQVLGNESESVPISDAEQFIEELSRSIAQRQPQPVASSIDGGTVYSDGSIKYSDGSFRQGDANAQPVATNADGSVRYSDGSVRMPEPKLVRQISPYKALYDDGSIRYVYAQGEGGQAGLISGVFGQDRPITQQYGNINPIEPTPGNVNLGTDIRTRDLQGQARNLALPMDAEVVEVYQDDGTQFGAISGHKGYGNSVLLRLPSGEMLRFSHLSRFGEGIQAGQVISAGQTIGIPGDTGNAYGEHLDLEYYNANGQVDNPNNFTGFADPSAVGIRESMSVADNLSPEEQQIAQQYQSDLAGARAGEPRSMDRLGREAELRGNINPGNPQVLGSTATATPQNPVARSVANAGQRFNAPELGVSEFLDSPSRQTAGNTVNALGAQVGAKDFQIGEAVKGQVGASQPFGNLTAEAGSRLGLPEAGVSENIKDIDFTDLAGSARNKVDDFISRFRESDTNPFASRQAYAGAGQGLQNTNIRDNQDDILKDIATKQSVTGIASNVDGSTRTTAGNVLPVQSLADGGVGVRPNPSINRASTKTLGNNRDNDDDDDRDNNKSKSSKSSSSSKSGSSKSSSKSSSSSKNQPKQSVQRYQSTYSSAPKQSKQRYQSVAPKQSTQKKSSPAPKKSTFSKAISKIFSFFTRR